MFSGALKWHESWAILIWKHSFQSRFLTNNEEFKWLLYGFWKETLLGWAEVFIWAEPRTSFCWSLKEQVSHYAINRIGICFCICQPHGSAELHKKYSIIWLLWVWKQVVKIFKTHGKGYYWDDHLLVNQFNISKLSLYSLYKSLGNIITLICHSLPIECRSCIALMEHCWWDS